MKKLFVHQPLFRLLSPLVSGIIIYLLVLLLNNNIQQILEEFINDELYFCIILSYLIQEFSRILLLLFKRVLSNKLTLANILVQIVVSMVLCVIISTISISLYFKHVLKFTASTEEIYVFNSIFCVVTFIYIVLYISHQYLYKINSEKLEQEQLIKQNIEDEFKQFKKGINPNLLFESFETLLFLIKNDKEKTDDFIDHLATIYRYILSGKEKQLVDFNEELVIVEELVKLFNYLPYRNITINNNCKKSFLIVPGSLLLILEQIVRTSINYSNINFIISFDEEGDSFIISYYKNDKIISEFNLEKINDIVNSYYIYSEQVIEVLEESTTRKIILPKLKIII